MYAKTSLFAALAVALVGLSAGPTLAAETNYTANLTGAGQVPDPIKTSAEGELQLVVSADGRSIRYVLTVKDMLNPAAGDLHLGPAGANGPLVAKLFPVGGAAAKKGPFSGVLAQGTIDAGDLIGPLKGEKLEALLEQIRDGNAYVNVHTNDGMEPANTGPGDYPLGEIRGQIVRQ
jgi:hypothetical protein